MRGDVGNALDYMVPEGCAYRSKNNKRDESSGVECGRWGHTATPGDGSATPGTPDNHPREGFASGVERVWRTPAAKRSEATAAVKRWGKRWGVGIERCGGDTGIKGLGQQEGRAIAGESQRIPEAMSR